MVMSRSTRQRWTVLGVLVGSGAALVALAVSLGAGAAQSGVAPQNTLLPVDPPTITGSPQEGKKLVGNRGVWTGDPTDFDDFWVRCDEDGVNCAPIGGATNRAGYVLRGVDVGDTIRFKVQANNAIGDATSVSSAPTAVIAPATKPAAADPTGCGTTSGRILARSISRPARLSIDRTRVSPSVIGRRTRVVVARFHVSACNGSVGGALVYATAVPYGQFSIPNEQVTGADGWATLRFTALAGFPVGAKQQLLVMFARARKPGEPLLAGISTRRLVSFVVTPR